MCLIIDDHRQKLEEYGIFLMDTQSTLSTIQFFGILYQNLDNKEEIVRYLLNNQLVNVTRGLDLAKTLGRGKYFRNISADILELVQSSLQITINGNGSIVHIR